MRSQNTHLRPAGRAQFGEGSKGITRAAQMAVHRCQRSHGFGIGGGFLIAAVVEQRQHTCGLHGVAGNALPRAARNQRQRQPHRDTATQTRCGMPQARMRDLVGHHHRHGIFAVEFFEQPAIEHHVAAQCREGIGNAIRRVMHLYLHAGRQVHRGREFGGDGAQRGAGLVSSRVARLVLPILRDAFGKIFLRRKRQTRRDLAGKKTDQRGAARDQREHAHHQPCKFPERMLGAVVDGFVGNAIFVLHGAPLPRYTAPRFGGATATGLSAVP